MEFDTSACLMLYYALLQAEKQREQKRKI